MSQLEEFIVFLWGEKIKEGKEQQPLTASELFNAFYRFQEERDSE